MSSTILKQRRTEFGTLAEMSFHPGKVAAHCHDETHLWLLLRGDFQEHTGTSVFNCFAGDVTIHPSGVPHQQNIISECRSIRFELRDAARHNFANRVELPNVPIVLKDRPVGSHCLRSIPRFWETGKAAEMSIVGFVYLLFARMFQNQSDNSEPVPCLLDKAVEFIDLRYRDPISLKDISELINVPKTRAARLFKNKFGITVGNYILERRVNSAMDDLAETTHSIASVALDNGFCDQAHLTRALKSITGFTPFEYRRLNSCDDAS